MTFDHVIVLTAVSISTTRCVKNVIIVMCILPGISAVTDLLLIDMPDCDFITHIIQA